MEIDLVEVHPLRGTWYGEGSPRGFIPWLRAFEPWALTRAKVPVNLLGVDLRYVLIPPVMGVMCFIRRHLRDN